MNVSHEIYHALEEMLILPPETSVPEAWAKIFKVSGASREFFLMLIAMQAKFESLQAQLNFADIDNVERRLYNGAADRLKNFASPQNIYGLQVVSLRNQQADIDTIYLSGRVLGDVDVPEINEITIEALIKDLKDFFVSINECKPELSPKLKELMTSSVRVALSALTSYHILGIDGFNQVFGSVIYGVLRVGETAGKEAQTHRTLLANFTAVFKKVSVVVALAHTAVSGAAGLIEDGSKIVDFVTGADDTTEAPATLEIPHLPLNGSSDEIV